MYLLYTLLGLLYFATLVPVLGCRALRRKKYVGTIGQRFGDLPVSVNVDGDESIWIHAVSVGEALLARALVPELRRLYPRLRVVMSTTTVAGQEAARTQIPELDAVFYFPIDVPPVVNRLIRIVRPRVFLMIETEIWPNLLRACRRAGVRTLLVNGRISARSFPRYRLVPPGFRRAVLADVDRYAVQNEETRRRLVRLGADPARITVTGNVKFDALGPPGRPGRPGDRVLRYFQLRPGRPVLVAGSTLKGEEAVVLRAFERLRGLARDMLLIVAPRHPERFADVERLSRDLGFDTVRRTELRIDAEPAAEVVVLDTIGELAHVYEAATVVFVGGSLVAAGGHNILEPAMFGKPIVFGPHMENFAEIADTVLGAGAAVQVESPAELEPALRRLFTQPAERTRLGDAARAIIDANRGAREKTVQMIAELLPPASLAARGEAPLRLVRG